MISVVEKIFDLNFDISIAEFSEDNNNSNIQYIV